MCLHITRATRPQSSFLYRSELSCIELILVEYSVIGSVVLPHCKLVSRLTPREQSHRESPVTSLPRGLIFRTCLLLMWLQVALFYLGDDDIMHGVLAAGVRSNMDAVFLVFLID